MRQEEAKKLASEVDCMIVIGGYNSANTKRLAEVCTEIQPEPTTSKWPRTDSGLV